MLRIQTNQVLGILLWFIKGLCFDTVLQTHTLFLHWNINTKYLPRISVKIDPKTSLITVDRMMGMISRILFMRFSPERGNVHRTQCSCFSRYENWVSDIAVAQESFPWCPQVFKKLSWIKLISSLSLVLLMGFMLLQILKQDFPFNSLKCSIETIKFLLSLSEVLLDGSSEK